MRKMKDSGIEWIGEIPDNWYVRSIKYSFSIIAGSTPDSGNRDYWEGSIPWITPADYKTDDRTIEHGARYLTELVFFSCSTSLIPIGSVIFSKRAPIGTVAINTKELCTNQGCLGCIKKDELVNSTYFYYVFSIFTNIFELYGSGTTFKEISANVFSNIIMPYPSIAIQNRVVDYLDKKCKEMDSLMSDIQKQIEILEKYKKSVITEAVTKGLNPNVEMRDSGISYVGNIPADWKIHPLYYYFGERKNKNNLGKEENLLSLSYGKIIRKDITLNGGLLPESFTTYNIVEKDDIIIRPTDLQNDKRSLRTGLVKEHGIITSAYITLKRINQINVEYVHYLLHAFDVMKVFYNMGNGVRQGLNYSEFSRLQIFEPSIMEQDEIVYYLNKKCAEIDYILKDKQEQLKKLAEYKKSLIFEFVTGKKGV